jgi:hypothetical protein
MSFITRLFVEKKKFRKEAKRLTRAYQTVPLISRVYSSSGMVKENGTIEKMIAGVASNELNYVRGLCIGRCSGACVQAMHGLSLCGRLGSRRV